MDRQIAFFRNFLVFLALTGSLFARVQAVDPDTDSESEGTLFIVGGALRGSNAEVMNRFIELATVRGERRILIVPAASGSPARVARRFSEDLVRYGARPGEIEILPLAVRNDRSTEFDESTWAGNAQVAAYAEQAASATGFWFLGGDQTRITELLLTGEGEDTPVLAAIRSAVAAGAVLGGTSAGAAMQSDPMIAGGVSLAALLGETSALFRDMNDQETGPLIIRPGLGFFPFGMIDQHFDRKARLGRLIVAAHGCPEGRGLGFGVDEDTAFEVDLRRARGRVWGPGNVTVVDLREASVKGEGDARRWENIRLHLLASGDAVDLRDLSVEVGQGRTPTRDQEYFHVPDPAAQGPLTPNPFLSQLLGFDLLDNSAVSEVETHIWHADGRGFQFVFSRGPETQGFWGTNDGTMDRYSGKNILLRIEPVRMEIQPR
ncbi:MAG: cyanophycinase [Opitutales bacterium]|nr:cyanophycinase [Opitutales bacterium]